MIEYDGTAVEAEGDVQADVVLVPAGEFKVLHECL